MSFKKLKVVVASPDGRTKDLSFLVQNRASAQIWAGCLAKAIPEGLRETKRFNNFPGQKRSQLNFILDDLQTVIVRLKRLHPTLEFPALDLQDLQNSVNNLHFNFAHGHHVTKHINSSNSDLWGEFNILLHTTESVLRNQKHYESTGLHNARIDFTWQNCHAVPIPEESYVDFTIRFDFGTVFLNYAQVGRHIYEMYWAQDDHLADEHILPQRVISANTTIFLGPTMGHEAEKRMLADIEKWFAERQARFNRLGFFWGDPKLALGRIPVARIEEPLYTVSEISQFVSELSAYNEVQSVHVL